MSMSGSWARSGEQEPLHQQVVPQRVDPGDAEQVVDQAAGARPAGRDPDPHAADQVAHLADGEEVRRVAQLGDRRQLVVEPLRTTARSRCADGPGVAPADPRLAPLAQHGVGVLARRRGRAPRPRAGGPTRSRGRPAGRAGTGRPGPRVAASSRAAPSLGRPRPGRPRAATGAICRAGAQVALGADPVDVPGVEGDQPPGRVQDVDGRRAVRRRVPDGVGQDGGHAGLAGQRQHPGRVPDAAPGCPAARGGRPPRRPATPAGSAARHRSRTARARSGRPGQHRPADLGVRARAGRPGPGAPSCRGRRVLGDQIRGRRPGGPARRAGGWPRPAGTAGPSRRRRAARSPRPRPRASTVTRGCRGSTLAPPRTGVPPRRPGPRAPARRPRRADRSSSPLGSTARSTPSSGATPPRGRPARTSPRRTDRPGR